MTTNANHKPIVALAAGCLRPPPGPGRIALALAFGGLTHLAFAAGVGSMIWAMFHGLSRSFGTVPWPWATVANAGLILQFPLVHSLMLTQGGQRVLGRLVPGAHGRRLSTTTYALIASVQLLVLFLGWTPSGIVWWRAEGVALALMCAAYAGAWLLLGVAILDAGVELQSGALGWMSVLQGIPLRFPDMPTGGLFRLIRQPIYLAFALTLWTVPVWTPDQLALAVAFTAYCVAAPRLKEARFARLYGDRFRGYSDRVPYMIPCLGRPLAIRNDLSIYDGAADRWWSDDLRWVRTLRAMVPARLRWFDRFADWRGARVLDLGCAGGFMAEAMARRGAIVTGLDPSRGAIDAARAHADTTGLAITYDVGVGEALPYGDAAFDTVVCVDVLEHVSDLPAVLAEVARVLRPGGVFLFDTINRNALSRLIAVTVAERILRLLPRGTHDPAMFIRPAELRVGLARAGLVAGRFAGLGPRGVDRRLDLTFGRVPGTAILYMGMARKPI